MSIVQLPFVSNWLVLVLDLDLVAAGSIEGTAENPSEGEGLAGLQEEISGTGLINLQDMASR
ncbi:hypothetical protein [Pseudomonas sp. NBRC 100443]|uniref:hypothetical protein n=1 Tax=Pseudomonas sp. NBRC 100443 TaxID=1113665 RepID=UPI002557BD82|nr:hypothetical protein [Pseudomonas sp. NBRC 100443]